jgi:hypothetical protein
MPKQSMIFVIVIASAVFIVFTLITSPALGQVSTQRLILHVCAYAHNPVSQFTVVATYKGETQKQTHNYDSTKHCSRWGGMWVSFTFAPKERGLLDFYQVTVTNLDTREKHFENPYWFPGSRDARINMEIYSSR